MLMNIKQISRIELIEELFNLQEKLNHPPTSSDLHKYSKYPIEEFEREFKGKFKKSDVEPNKTELLDDLASLFGILGRLPTRTEVRARGKFSTTAYEKVFGSFSQAKREAFESIDGLKDYNEYFKLEGDFIITSDWHIPYYNPDICNNMIAISEKFGINRLIIAGDFFNQDSFSHYQSRDVVNFGDEKDIARKILDILCQTYEEIYILTGNHDIRLLKLLSFKLKIDDIWNMVSQEIGKKIKISEYPYLRINGQWHITHPKNFSILPTSVARKMNHKYKMSVGVAHGHSMGVTYSPSGDDVLFDTGGMFNQEKIEYSKLNDTTHNEWQTGFSMLKNNYLYQFPMKHTDWDFWLK